MSRVLVTLFILTIFSSISAAQNVACILQHCGLQILGCEVDAGCKTTLSCVSACPAENQQVCQVNCTELYADATFDTLSKCMVDNKCFSPPPNPVVCPAPLHKAPKFNPNDLNGQWFTLFGLSQAYDCFACQRYDIQTSGQYSWAYDWHFVVGENETRMTPCNITMPDPIDQPDQLQVTYNEHGVPGLDNWTVISADTSQSPAAYLLIYYCGSNPMMPGYQGGVLLSRTQTLESRLLEQAQQDAAQAGLEWSLFCPVQQNGCPF